MIRDGDVLRDDDDAVLLIEGGTQLTLVSHQRRCRTTSTGHIAAGITPTLRGAVIDSLDRKKEQGTQYNKSNLFHISVIWLMLFLLFQSSAPLSQASCRLAPSDAVHRG